MNERREMTLDEWVESLPAEHLARKQLEQERADRLAADDRIRELEAEDAGRDLMDAEADSFLAGKVVVDRVEYEAQEARIRLLEQERRELFPMQFGPMIPRWLAEVVFRIYEDVYGKGGQALDEIGRRGGFGWSEVEAMTKDYCRHHAEADWSALLSSAAPAPKEEGER